MNTDKLLELDNQINALRCEYAEYTVMYTKKMIPIKEWIVVARQITLEIVELTDQYVNS